jgi:hypothetical protein
MGHSVMTLARKVAFNQSPSKRKVSIARRQGPDAMQVVRQQNKGINAKRVGIENPPDAAAQQCNIIFPGQYLCSFKRNNSKEIAPALAPGPSVSHKSKTFLPPPIQ